MPKAPVTVVVIARNEAENIEDCLKSVAPWADEIVVLDDNSTDNTVALAKKYTDKVFSRKMDNEGRHRNYAYSLAKNQWVLSLDADERASAELGQEITELFKNPMPHVVYNIPIKTYIGDKWVRYGGWYPAPKDRLFDKDKFKYEEAEVHPRVIYQGTCGRLKSDIIHYSYKDYHDFLLSLNNQTTLEAKKWFKERRPVNFIKMYRKACSRFIKAYFQKGGIKGGLQGFVVSWAGAAYQFMSYIKYREMLENEAAKCEKKNCHCERTK